MEWQILALNKTRVVNNVAAVERTGNVGQCNNTYENRLNYLPVLVGMEEKMSFVWEKTKPRRQWRIFIFYQSDF